VFTVFSSGSVGQKRGSATLCIYDFSYFLRNQYVVLAAAQNIGQVNQVNRLVRDQDDPTAYICRKPRSKNWRKRISREIKEV